MYMKKTIAIALLVLAPMSVSANVDKQAGIEFLSPLVQTIIQLLQERIAVLAQEVAFLKANQPVCGAVAPQITPQQKANEMNTQEANRIRAEFSQKYIAIDEKINVERKIISDSKAEIIRLGSGITANEKNTLDKRIQASENVIITLENEKASLKIEERRQLSFVGVY